MRKRKSKNKRLYQRITFWLGILVLGTAVGLAIQFTRAWVEPLTTAPNGNIAAPINTGATTQVKKGGDICVDTNSDGVNEACVSSGGSGGGVPDGSIVMWSGSAGSIPAGWVLCDGKHNTPDMRGKFIMGSSGGLSSGSVYLGGGSFVTSAYGEHWVGTSSGSVAVYAPYFSLAFIKKDSTFAGDTIITNGDHYASECTSAGGTVQIDGTKQFCKFIQSSCPSGWSQYNNWSTTTAQSKTGTVQNGCPGAKNCATSSHGWGNIARESCSYTDALWNSSSYVGYYCGYPVNDCSPVDQTACSYSCDGDSCYWNCTYCSWYPGCTYDNNYCSNPSTLLYAKLTEVGCY